VGRTKVIKIVRSNAYNVCTMNHSGLKKSRLLITFQYVNTEESVDGNEDENKDENDLYMVKNEE